MIGTLVLFDLRVIGTLILFDLLLAGTLVLFDSGLICFKADAALEAGDVSFLLLLLSF